MALIFCDSFDSCNAPTDLSKKWQTAQGPWQWIAGAGKFGGGAASTTGTGTGRLISTIGSLPTNANCIGFWLKASAPPASTAILVAPVDGSGLTNGEQLNLNTNGNIALFVPFQGGAGTIAPKVITDNSWHWIEWETQGAGTRQLFIDNILQINTSDAHAAPATAIAFFSISGITLSIDDVVVYDNETGAPTLANYPLSARQITVLRPISDGVVGFSTVSAGTAHWAMLSETSPDGDASYVQDNIVGNQDLLNFVPMTFTPSGLTGIMMNIYLTNPTGGTINHKIICKSGSAPQASSPVVPTPTSYFTQQAAFTIDPNTGAAWTVAGLNAAQFGYLNA